jgi:hypothetical protein
VHEYEIRILRADGGATLITAEIQLNDNAAIRSAQKLAKGQKFEVWKGMDCIYGTGTTPSRDGPPSNSPAA